MGEADLPDPGALEAARARIAGLVHRTPIMASASLDALAGAELYFKCEQFQKVGAVEARGAASAVFALGEEEAARGVATHSGGNHGVALAWAAALRGVPCSVVMPVTAPPQTRAAVLRHGARVVDCAPGAAAREAGLAVLVAETGAVPVHPSGDQQVIAGLASCAFEVLEDLGGVDAIVVPIGSGGLAVATCLACASVAPFTEVRAVEPGGAGDADRRVEAAAVPPGLRTRAALAAHGGEVLVVPEGEVAGAMRLVWERLKVVVEPSAALPLAGILRHREAFEERRVAVVLTGGNVDVAGLGAGLGW